VLVTLSLNISLYIRRINKGDKMNLRTVLKATVIVLGLSLSAIAADISGKWAAQIPGRQGNAQEATFTFKADGDKVRGAMTTRRGEVELKDGKLNGDEITFSTTQAFQGRDVKNNFAGKVSGDEIKFNRKRDGGNGKGQEFTAKRVK
jgi:hypothetical protein